MTTDPGLIATLIEPYIASDPVRATVLGTIQSVLRNPPADRSAAGPWAASVPGGIAARSQLHTPASLLGAWPDPAPLAVALTALRPRSVNGPQRLVDPVCDAMQAGGAHPRARIDERLFRLDELTEPARVPGRGRTADEGDYDLLIDWWGAFAAEARDPAEPAELAEAVGRVLDQGRQWLWLDTSDRPVSMAGGRFPVAGSGRVGPVYTPPEHRGRGYGSAVTAAATRQILSDGAVPVLFTDRSNPTSNKIYQQLGYRPVENYALVSFDWTSGNTV